MRIVLTTLNAKFTHDSLAVRYLEAYCIHDFPELITRQFNINQNLDLILSELVDLQPDIIGFSCYIWNIEPTLELVSNLKKIYPQLIILLGGPEVSYDYHQLMHRHNDINYCIAGEGEEPFLQLLKLLKRTKNPTSSELRKVSGLVYRQGQQILDNPTAVMNLDTLPSAYSHSLSGLENKIVYYETSRGCPFKCEYCLSSRSGAVRYFPLDQCKKEIFQLSRMDIEQIRFVDRTFNCHPGRAKELLKFIIGLDTNTRFQLEIGGDLLDAEMLSLLEKAPPNRLQFEIGVQSTNPATLKQIGRTTNLDLLAANVKILQTNTNVRFLLDLIAGLPEETLDRFGESFDFVYNLKPTKIQLGFLKLLKGSRLRERVEDFGCIFTARAPYEVLGTNSISYTQLAFLKVIDDLVEMFYNSGRFGCSLDYLVTRDGLSPFKFLSGLASKWKTNGYHLVFHNIFNLYKLLWELMGEKDQVLLNYLRFDYRSKEPRRATPTWLQSDSLNNVREYTRNLVHSETIYEYLPSLKPLKLSPRQLSGKFMVEQFDYEIYPWRPMPKPKKQLLLFDYSEANQIEVIELESLL